MAGVDLNWGAEQPRQNIMATTVQAFEQGQQLGLQRLRRTAFSRLMGDPAGAEAMLANAGDMEGMSAAAKFNAASQEQAALAQARPMIEQGNYEGAAQTTATYSPDVAKALMGFRKDDLERSQVLHERGAAILAAAANLSSADDRIAFIGDHMPELKAAGVSEDHIGSYDLSDTGRLRADADALSKVSDVISAHMRESELGETRRYHDTQSGLDGQRIAETLRHNQVEEGQGAGRLGIDQARLEQEGQTTGKVLGRIVEKARSGQALDPGDIKALEIYATQIRNPDPYADTNNAGTTRATQPPGAPPRAMPRQPQPGVRPGARPNSQPGNGTFSHPVTPASQADFDRLPVGAWFVNPRTGARMQKTH